MAKYTRRNRMVVRLWEVLHRLESGPATLAELVTSVADGSVTDRTIRRDLEALQEAGFSLYDERHDDGMTRWHLLSKGVTPERRAA